MAGQGWSKARKCIKARGFGFRERPRVICGMSTCRACGYQTALHETILRKMIAECGRRGPWK